MQTKSMTALQLGQMIKKKEVSVKEAVQESLAQIADLDETLGSFVTASLSLPIPALRTAPLR